MNPAVLALGALLALVPILGAEELLPADALAQATLTGATGQARTSWEASTGERLLTVATAQPRPWGVGLKIPLRQDLPVGTLVTLSAEVRLVAGERGSLHVGLQRHQPPWTKPVFVHTDPGRTWTVIRGLGQVTERLPAGGVDVVLHAGLQAQTLAVRRLQVGRWSRTEDLPPEFRTYAGREAEASWRGPAAERIARYRQAEVTVVVRDDQGRPVPGFPSPSPNSAKRSPSARRWMNVPCWRATPATARPSARGSTPRSSKMA